jgi:hypothetical protein
MTSLLSGLKQNGGDGGYYYPVSSLYGKIYQRGSEPTSNTGVIGGTFSTASWANTLTYGKVLSTLIPGSGFTSVLRDMGRTVVSSLRTFRKVQLIVPAVVSGTSSTFGVGGQQATVAGSVGEDYFTGYIELGFEGNGVPAAVASFGR